MDDTKTEAGNGAMAVKARRTLLGLAGRRYLAAFILIAPAVLLRLFTSVYPFLQTAYLSLFEYNPTGPVNRFIAFGNYLRMRKDIVVRESIFFTILFVFVSTAFQLLFGLAIAMLLNADFRLKRASRTINLVPWAIPMVVAAIGFRWMFDDQYGIINDLLARAIGWRYPWLVRPWGARIAVIATNVWKNAPFLAIVFLAGLQGIPRELYEAAKVDGAGRFHSFRYITVPLVSPLITTMAIFFIIWQLAAFDLIYGMTGGGPGFATAVLAYKIFQEAFTGLNFGYASAISMILFFCVAVVGVVGLIVFQRQEVTL